MQIFRNLDMVHPILKQCIKKIQTQIIDGHNMPIRLFETGRDHERHNTLIQRGKTKDPISRHLYNLENIPPLYSTAVDYVYYDKKWSWNLRDSTVMAWYVLFGNLVLDVCPELQWSGESRKDVNYCHFELKREIMVLNWEKIPCVLP